jgi:tRNA nucleotidyltransferase (CCA-adding enzyme)
VRKIGEISAEKMRVKEDLDKVLANDSRDINLVRRAVRDKILNNTYQDNDYVVVGSTIEEMLLLGFEKVGKSFPVFLHPRWI